MDKVKFLAIICIGLLVVNIALIGLLITQKPQRPPHEGPKMIIIEKLHFDESQIKEYEALIDWHRSEVRRTDEEMTELKKQLYQSLNSNQSSSNRDSLFNEIGKLQIKIEKIHYQHFEDIKKLCKPEQQTYFEEFTKKITDLFPRRRHR